MSDSIRRIVILGGGSAGWLVAGIIAAEHLVDAENGIQVILVESPDVPIIGVGEGTWPSMRTTLKKIGVSETDFIRECDASFKQGSKFTDWVDSGDGSYYHPFTLPDSYTELNPAAYWLPHREKIKYADAVGAQSHLSDRFLAPKQITTPEFAGIANYGYHLDAGKFSQFLKRHCVEKLGVTHIVDHVTEINSAPDGDIASLSTQSNGKIAGDLFIDCTGFASLLLGEHYQIPFKPQHDILFNDSALAVQVPYSEADAPIASCTISTAQDCGWIWDIGLPTRRGVGHVYSSAHTSDEHVERNMRLYLEPSLGKAMVDKLSMRKLQFKPGYREKLWHRNCVAVGISAGFIEPLEATALVLIELSAQMLSEQLPANRQVMDVIANRFNEKFAYRWRRIIEFLKLHYVLSKRKDSEYWMDHYNLSSIPSGLQDQLSLWRYQSPWKYDFLHVDEMFPSASYQFVLYGMEFETLSPPYPKRMSKMEAHLAAQVFNENRVKTQKLLANLPTNRALLNKLREFEFQKI